MRQAAYWLARVLGDWNAVRKGTVHKRIVNKAIGRHVVRRMWWK